jgi:hypothetical protein
MFLLPQYAFMAWYLVRTHWIEKYLHVLYVFGRALMHFLLQIW